MTAKIRRKTGNRRRLLSFLVAASAIATVAATACNDDDPVRPADEVELDRARSATERYQDVNRAIADGYVDAHIVMQGMGHHFLNASLVDDRFDPEKPELLVYAPDAAGKLRLVALEYAVPLDKSASAPAGFTGTGDVWSANQKYGLWTLHAWIWLDNAAGVFNATNDKVVLDPGTIQGDAGHDMH